MKKTRLLEIIKEEIDTALNEIPDFGGRIDDQVADKYSEEATLESATNEIVDEVLADMGVTRADLKKDADKAKEILKVIRKKVVGKNQDPRVTAALEKQEDFDDSGNLLQANQTNNFILKALDLKEPGKRGRKPSPSKPEKVEVTGSDKKETTPEDISLDDEGPSTKELEKDETAKSLGSTPDDKKEKFNLGLRFIKKYKDDKAKIDAYMKKAKEEYKLSKSMLDDLNRAAGRGSE
tara:strand:+ start:850 stop:1557 length:708 start_codon:yes stop_codon:yes gene_type:complete